MYNLNQSYSAGYLNYVDMKSLNIAGTSSKQLKETLIQTAEAMGKIKKGAVTIDNFDSTLKNKWADRAVMEKAFAEFTTSTNAVYNAYLEAEKYKEEHGLGEDAYGLYKLPDGTLKEYSTAQQAIKDIGTAYGELGYKAFKSAQEAKTFNEAMDYTKDAVSSAWKKIFKTIFGNYEQAKDLWTGLTESLYEVFVQPLELIDAKIKTAFDKVKQVVDKTLEPIKKTSKTVKEAVKTATDYSKVVDEIIQGKWNNASTRWKKLTEAGYDWAHAQNLVNERLGCSVRHATKYKEETNKTVVSKGKLTKETKKLVTELIKLSDEELKAKGYTDDQIKAFRNLDQLAKKLGISVGTLLDKADEIDGRWLLINGFKNIGSALISILNSVKEAWSNVFGMSEDAIANALMGFHRITAAIKSFVEGNADKLMRTLRGIFSIIHIITSILKTGLKVALSFIGGLLGKTNVNVLDLTASIGDAIYEFDRWLTSSGKLLKIFNYIGQTIRFVVGKIVEWVTAGYEWAKSNEKIMAVVNKIKSVFSNLGGSVNSWFKGLEETKNVPEYIISGLVNGLKKGASKVYSVISKIAENLITTFKTILAIASPSKVFFAIGVFLISGLIKGMLDGSIDLFGTAKDIVQRLFDIFKNLNIGNVIAIGMTTGLVVTINKIVALTNKLLDPLEGLKNMLSGIGRMATSFGLAAEDYAKSKKFNAIGNMIKNIGIAIALLAGSLWILAKLPADQLKQGGIALGVITGILVLFFTAITVMAKKMNAIQLPDMKSILAAVIGIAVSLFIMSSALKKMSKIENIENAIYGLLACAIALSLLLAVLASSASTLKETKNIQEMGKVFTKIAASMLLMAVALKIIDKLSNNAIIKACQILGGVILLLAVIAGLNKYTGDSIIKSAETIKAVGISLLLLAIATKIAGMLKLEDFVKAIGVIGLFTILLVAIMAVSKKFKGTEMVKVGASILFIVGAIALLGLAAYLLGNMDVGQFIKGTICVAVLGIIVKELIAVAKNSKSAHAMTLLGVAALIMAMGAIAWLLGQIEVKKLIKGVAAVGALSLFVSALLLAAKDFNPGAKAMSTMITIIVMLVLLTAAMVGLSFLDTRKLLSASTAMGEVVLALAAVIYSVGKLKPEKGMIKNLLMITGILFLLTGVVAILSLIPNTNSVIKGALGVTILAGALSIMMFALSKIDGQKSINIKSILGLYALVPLLAAIGFILTSMSNTKNAIKNALALSILMGVMVLVLAAVSAVGQFLGEGLIVGVLGLLGITIVLGVIALSLAAMDNLKNAMKNAQALSLLLGVMAVVLLIAGAIGTNVVGVLVGVVGLLAIVGELFLIVKVLEKMEGLQNAVQNALALSILLTAMSNALFKLALVGPLALIADVAIAGLIAIIGGVAVLATAIGALMTKFPQLESFLDTGLPILEKIASSIGVMLGNLVANFLGHVADELPHLAMQLSTFMTYAMPFVTLAQTVNDKVLTGVSILAKSILALTGANLVNAIATWVSGGQSFSELGTQLSDFADNSKSFIKTISKVKPEALEGAKNLAQAVLYFTEGNFIDQLSSKLFGESDAGEFGKKLETLAKGLSSFVNNLKGFDKKNLSTIEVACEGIKDLTGAAKDMPKDGGLWQRLVGSVDMESFGQKLPKLAEGLVGFVKELNDGGFSGADQGMIKTATDMIKDFINMAKDLPNDGGIWQKLAGGKNIGDFADNFPKVGKGVAGFVSALSGENGNGLTKDSVDSTQTAVNIMWAIAGLAGLDISKISGDLSGFGEKLPDFGVKLSEFISKIKDINKTDLSDSLNKMDLITELAQKLSKIDSKVTKSFKDFTDKLKNFGSTAIQEFINTLQNIDVKTKAEAAITSLLDALNTVLTNHEKPFYDEGVKLVGEAAKGLEDSGAVEKAKQAGRNFGQGFIDGIQEKKTLANTMANGLGTFANKGLQTGIDSHSPSKITHRLGNFFGQGFINGIKEYSSRVYDQSSDLANRANKGLSNAIASVSKLISDGIDDDLTIRPVLDLSNVESGVAAMNGMFGTPSVGVMSNLNSITNGMRNYRQNNGEEVVSAIDRLKDNLGNVSGDTYNIDGITYDDGSNIADAVQTLVRAARIERRK